MATTRQPFAVLDSPRLQHLTSIKNRQNGLNVSPMSAGKSPLSNMSKPGSSPLQSATKRRHSPATFDEDGSYDAENVDPSVFLSPSKRTKCNDSTPVMPSFATSAFTFSKASSISTQAATPGNKHTTTSPRAPLTAPAGRSPRAIKNAADKARRISDPYKFTRIDPPKFSRPSTTSVNTVPLSLDAALSGTLFRSSAKSSGSKASPSGIQETMPRAWFFDIHEDTPDEEAANLMEHSTLTLDISSDEEGRRKQKADSGKENIAPAEYTAPQTRSAAVNVSAALSRTTQKEVRKTQKLIRRRKVIKQDAMDDGNRSPLSDLETEDFIPEGLDKESVEIIPVIADHAASKDTWDDAEQKEQTPAGTFPAPLSVEQEQAHVARDVLDVPVFTKDGDLAGDIIIFEDEENVSDAGQLPAQVIEVKSGKGEKRKRVLTEMEGQEENVA